MCGSAFFVGIRRRHEDRKSKYSGCGGASRNLCTLCRRNSNIIEYEVPSVDEFRNRIEQISAKYPYIKAVVDGKIAGYAYAAGFKDRKAYDWSVETTIYIRKDCRQLGLGKALYENLEKLLKEMGILNMNVCIASPAAESGHLTDDSYRFHKKWALRWLGVFITAAISLVNGTI